MENNVRKLFVVSEPVEKKPRLLGILMEENGKYSFEYKVKFEDTRFVNGIAEFPIIDTKYTGAEVLKYINRIIPSPDHTFILKFLNAINAKEYDVWGLLKYCGATNTCGDSFLYENLPVQCGFIEK